jgi:hypothetical protein
VIYFDPSVPATLCKTAAEASINVQNRQIKALPAQSMKTELTFVKLRNMPLFPSEDTIVKYSAKAWLFLQSKQRFHKRLTMYKTNIYGPQNKPPAPTSNEGFPDLPSTKIILFPVTQSLLSLMRIQIQKICTNPQKILYLMLFLLKDFFRRINPGSFFFYVSKILNASTSMDTCLEIILDKYKPSNTRGYRTLGPNTKFWSTKHYTLVINR